MKLFTRRQPAPRPRPRHGCYDIAPSCQVTNLDVLLDRNPNVKFDKVIFAASIVRPDFDWGRLLAEGRVNFVENDYGGRDFWPRKRATTPAPKKTASSLALISQSAIVLYVPTPQMFGYRQAAACLRAAQKSATYRSPRSPCWQPWCRRVPSVR